MDNQKIEMFLLSKGDQFTPEQLPNIKERLRNVPDDYLMTLNSINFKNPTTAIILSVVLGGYGVDRFYIGDTGLGVGKLLTCGGCGIWTIIDWFKIMDDTRNKNVEKLLFSLSMNNA